MEFNEPETVQIRIEGLKLKQFLDTEFMGLLSKKFEDLNVVNITFVAQLDEEKKEFINMGYPFLELVERDQLIVDANEPESIKKIIEVLNDYKK
jgi:hypothetical protein